VEVDFEELKEAYPAWREGYMEMMRKLGKAVVVAMK
jgi:hypothetical protein